MMTMKSMMRTNGKTAQAVFLFLGGIMYQIKLYHDNVRLNQEFDYDDYEESVYQFIQFIEKYLGSEDVFAVELFKDHKILAHFHNE